MIAAHPDALTVLEGTYFYAKVPVEKVNENTLFTGLIVSNDHDKLASKFIAAIGMHRFWSREKPEKVSA